MEFNRSCPRASQGFLLLSIVLPITCEEKLRTVSSANVAFAQRRKDIKKPFSPQYHLPPPKPLPCGPPFPLQMTLIVRHFPGTAEVKKGGKVPPIAVTDCPLLLLFCWLAEAAVVVVHSVSPPRHHAPPIFFFFSRTPSMLFRSPEEACARNNNKDLPDEKTALKIPLAFLFRCQFRLLPLPALIWGAKRRQ